MDREVECLCCHEVNKIISWFAQVMANGHGEEASEAFNSFIEVFEDNHKTKIKWNSNEEDLKKFVDKNLKLCGVWSFVLSNGGYHFFKCSAASINFYPGTCTLLVQGPKADAIRKRIIDKSKKEPVKINDEISCQTQSESRSAAVGDESSCHSVPSDQQSSMAARDDISEVSSCSEGDDDDDESTDSDVEEIQSKDSKHTCNCSDIINSLNHKLSRLEGKFDTFINSQNLYQQDLVSKIKSLEEEKSGLMIALRVLANSAPCNSNRTDPPPSSSISTTQASENLRESFIAGSQFVGDNTQSTTNKPVDKPVSKSLKSNNKDETDVIIIGDSITKNVQGHKLSRKLKVKSVSFPGATIEDTTDFIKPYLRRKPKNLIIHVGTNNIKSDKPKSIKSKLANLIQNIKKDHTSVRIAVSSLTTRKDDPALTSKISSVNNSLEQYCKSNDIDFINNKSVDSTCINRGGLHLNRQGTVNLAANFRNYLHNLV